jgi:hypothetical protein
VLIGTAIRQTSRGGGCHDQADAEWIVIRRPLRSHNDMYFGRPTPGRPIGRPGVSRPAGVYGVFSTIDYSCTVIL